MLGYPTEGELRIRVTANPGHHAPDELSMETRSVLAAMYALAQDCRVPEEHLKNNEVYPGPGETEVDASKTWLRIEHSRTPQIDSFAQVYYNGYWFYIPKSDWSGKRTFSLLTYLFSLQASDVAAAQPVVTIPTGK